MNIWVTRLGNKNFDSFELEKLKKITEPTGLLTNSLWQYKNERVDYVSFSAAAEKTRKTYNHVNHHLRAYSGLLVNNTGSSTDFRDAKSLFSQNSLNSLAADLAGQFALIEASQGQFRCAVDAIGNHKIFYFTSNDGHIYVTNYLPFLEPFKKREINYQFLIDFIANGGTYGIESQEKNVYIIPASSELVWDSDSGLTIREYYSLEQMLTPTDNKDSYYEQAADQFRHAADYLADFHNLIVPLSGGYDSRMILKMFRETDLKKLTTFTYPDHPYDAHLAKKVARSKKLNHIEMESEGTLLTVEELHNQVANNYPFIGYSGVFFHQLNKDKYDLHDWDKVHIRGNTAVYAASYAAIKKLSHVNEYDGEKAIQKLAEYRINSKLLTDFGRENSFKNFEHSYREKYLHLYNQPINVDLAKLHFIYEKFGNHQGYRYTFTRSGNPSDLYFPFADRTFLKLILSSDVEYYIKEKKNSIHYRLYSQLNGCKIKKYPFTSGPHWDASNLEKKLFRFRNKYKKRFLTKFGIDTQKGSSQKRVEFINANLSHFKEIVHSTPNSGLWDYINRDNFIHWVSSEELVLKNLKPVLRVLPYLKLGI